MKQLVTQANNYNLKKELLSCSYRATCAVDTIINPQNFNSNRVLYYIIILDNNS